MRRKRGGDFDSPDFLADVQRSIFVGFTAQNYATLVRTGAIDRRRAKREVRRKIAAYDQKQELKRQNNGKGRFQLFIEAGGRLELLPQRPTED